MFDNHNVCLEVLFFSVLCLIARVEIAGGQQKMSTILLLILILIYPLFLPTVFMFEVYVFQIAYSLYFFNLAYKHFVQFSSVPFLKADAFS